MADQKVDNDEIFGKGLFAGKVKKDAETLIKVLNLLESDLINVAKAYKQILDLETGDTVKSINKVTKSTEELNEKEEQAQKIRKERAKLQKQLKVLNSDQVQSNEELKVQVSEQRKINKQLAKETLGLIGAYSKQSKRLRDLKNEYKDLITTQGKTTKESKKLLRQITKLDRELKDLDDSVGDSFRNIGKYEKAWDAAKKELLLIAGAAAAAKGTIDGLGSGLKSTEEGSEELRKASAAAEAVTTKFKGTVSAFALDVFSAFKNVKQLVQGKGGLGTISNLQNPFKRTSKSVENFVEDTEKLIDAEVKAEEQTIKLEKSIRPLNQRIEELNGLIEQQIAIAGDSTKGFEQIEDAAERAQSLQIERSNILLEIAQSELDIIQLKISERRKEGANVLGLLDDESAAIIKLQEAKNQVAIEEIENQKLLSENSRDRFERELDFAIDAFDSIKTVNERRIADERKTIKERKAILAETEKLTDSSFQNQIKLLREFTGENIDLNELSKESNEEAIRSNLRKFNFDDVTLGRVLEIIRERKIALQDLNDAQKDLNESESEAIELRADIIDQETALQEKSVESLEQLERDRFENTKKILEERLEFIEKDSLEELRIRKELNDLLLDENQRLLDEEAEQRKIAEDKKRASDEETAERLKELQETTIKAIEDIFSKSSKSQIDSLDKSIDKSQERIKELEEKAKISALSSDESIAFERRKREKEEREQERAKKRQERREALFTVLRTFNANDQDVGKTATDISTIRALADTLVGFFDGTDDVGKSLGKPLLKGRDGHIIRVDGKEQIWSEKDRRAVGFKSRAEIIDMVNNGNDASSLIANSGINSNSIDSGRIIIKDDRVVKGIDKLDRSINKIGDQKEKVYFDFIKGYLTYQSKRGNKTTRNHSKLK